MPKENRGLLPGQEAARTNELLAGILAELKTLNAALTPSKPESKTTDSTQKKG